MKKVSLMFMVLAVLALVVVGACGGENGEAKTTAAKTITPTTAATTAPQSTQPSNGGNGGNGGGFTWNDVPIYGGADQIQEFNMSFMPEEGEYSRVEWRYYETSDDIDDVIDFYKDKMPDNGWDETMWMDMMEVAYGMYMKNNEADAAMVWLSSDEGETQIALWRASE